MMVGRAKICAQCGTKGSSGHQRCSRCSDAWYCGVSCQHTHWKIHRKQCFPPPPAKEDLDLAVKIPAEGADTEFLAKDVDAKLHSKDVSGKLRESEDAGDWLGVLKWEGHMEELLDLKSHEASNEALLSSFANAHLMLMGDDAACSNDYHAKCIILLQEKRIPLLGHLQRFSAQGDAMCNVSSFCQLLERNREAVAWYNRARDIGAAHGFFSIQSIACRGLGMAALEEGCHEEGVALLQNALSAARMNELDDPMYELDALESLVQTLIDAKCIDDAEPLAMCYRKAANAQKGNDAYILLELDSILSSARIHQVMRLCIPRCESMNDHCSALASYQLLRRHQGGIERRHVHFFNLPSSLLCRHAGGTKIPRGRCALSSTWSTRTRPNARTWPMGLKQ